MPALNKIQQEILKLFKYEHTEEELLEIKQMLSEYLFKKAIEKADATAAEKGYTAGQMKNWVYEHYRTPKKDK